MRAAGLAYFDTAIGRCGVAWGEHGIVTVQLPEEDAAATRSRLERYAPDAPECEPPAAVREAVRLMVALLDGEPADLSGIEVDLSGVPAFHRRVYDLARTVGPGETTTYGEVATALGEPGAARAVGQARGRNPVPVVVPCHRVLAAGGRTGGFSAGGGTGTKLRMLAIEGAAPGGQFSLFG